MQKYKKVCKKLRSMPPYERNLTLYVCMARVLPPYVKFLKRSKNVCYIFLGGVCKSPSLDSLLLSKMYLTNLSLQSTDGGLDQVLSLPQSPKLQQIFANQKLLGK